MKLHLKRLTQLAPRLWRNLTLPSHKREWVLATLLILTNLYVWSGLYVYHQIYRQGRTEIISQAVRFYPLPAARVGGTVIPLSRYWRDVQAINTYIKESGTADRYKGISVEEQVMSRLLRAAAIRRLAQRYNLDVTEQEVEAEYRATAQQENDLLERNLQRYYGFAPADFKVWLTETLLERKVADSVPRRRNVAHILFIAESTAPPEAIEAAKRRAESVLTSIREGQDFAEMAKQHSNDAASRDKGGELGWITRGSGGAAFIDAQFEEASFSAPLGEVAGPFQSSRGWHLILAKEEAGQLDGSLDNIIKEELREAGLATYLR